MIKHIYYISVALLVFSISKGHCSNVSGKLLIPTDVKWEYEPSNPYEISPKKNYSFGYILYFYNDSIFVMLSATLLSCEICDTFSISQGDGGCFYKGKYEQKDSVVIIKYSKRYCWPKNIKKIETQITTDTITINPNSKPMLFRLNKSHYVENGKGVRALFTDKTDINWPIRNLLEGIVRKKGKP